jgi:phosphoglycerate-specific signal transduction histidine kinase
MEELVKIPDSVIIKSLRDEVKTLRRKNHEICVKAKEREEHWKAYTDELLNAIRVLEADEDEEKKLRREVKAMKKMNDDYNQLLTQHNNVVERYKLLKLQVKELKSELEGKPIYSDGPSRMEMRKKFNGIKNQREIMNEMCFAYNESMPKAYNAVIFLEWVRTNNLWEKLLVLMYGE